METQINLHIYVMVYLIKIVSFLYLKIKLFLKILVAHEYRHMKLTNIFAITNITRLDEECKKNKLRQILVGLKLVKIV